VNTAIVIDRLSGGVVSEENQKPAYPQRTRSTCPRCSSPSIIALPANNAGSDQEWFRCEVCDHMWSQRRDRTEQGERRPTPADSGTDQKSPQQD
jgi:hypothetical protein